MLLPRTKILLSLFLLLLFSEFLLGPGTEDGRILGLRKTKIDPSWKKKSINMRVVDGIQHLGGPGCLARAPGGKAMLEGRASGAGASGRGVRGAERDDLVLEVERSCSDTFLRAEADVRP